MLKDLGLGDGKNLGTMDGQIAMDCSIRKTRKGDSFVVSTTDFFFPLVDSPYLQGRIGAANVLSDLYAQGIDECDFVLMLLAACRDMPEDERKICTREMVKGFRDAVVEDANSSISGGQTVLNPWPIIGGVATSVVSSNEFILCNGAQAGDVIVLTKPLGTQVAVNVHQWKNEKKENRFWTKCQEEQILTDEAADDMIYKAICSMCRLNRNGAHLMLKHHANAATDVTGFGVLGHAQNLCTNQIEPVGIELHTLPCIAGSAAVNNAVFNFRLLAGYSAETSGGLMVCMPQEHAQAFIDEIQELDGEDAWIIGRVTSDTNRKAVLIENVKVIEV